jgi:PEP-CTERM motif
VIANGATLIDATFTNLVSAENYFHDRLIDLGDYSGPLDLSVDYSLIAGGAGGFGVDLAFAGQVPEPSTWAMMCVGFATLALAGWRSGARRRLGA